MKMRTLPKTLLFVILVLFFISMNGKSQLRSFANIKINNDSTTEIQNEEQIVNNPVDSTNIVAVWRDFRLGYRQVGYGYSFDGGITWNQALFSGTPYSRDSDPGLTVDINGNFYAVVLSYTGSTNEPDGLFVFRSTNGGASWEPPVTVIDSVQGVFEDKELISCDRSGGLYTGNLYVAWTRFYNTQILLSRSTDGGNSFIGPVTVSDINGVQWPVPCVGPNSEVYVAWVQYSPGAIRFDRSIDGGVTFGTDITIQNTSFVSGSINGGITVFSFPAMDVDITGGAYNGNIYIAYMDDSPGHTDEDIYFTRSTDGGNTWSTKIRINDDNLNNGCDQFHPWLTVDPDGNIIVVFLDRRLDPGNLLMDLYLTISTDGGNTWSTNERVTTVSSDPTAGSALMSFTPNHPVKIGKPVILASRSGLIGEYIGVTASSIDNIHPIWTDTRLGNQDVFTGYRLSQGTEEKKNLTKEKQDIIIYPEPFVNNIHIKFPQPVNENIVYSIFDVTGRQVYKGILKTAERKGKFIINCNSLRKGTHLLHLQIKHISQSYVIHKIK